MSYSRYGPQFFLLNTLFENFEREFIELNIKIIRFF
jgi:hypothetical protein